MALPKASQRDIDLLQAGKPPESPELLNAITVGQSVWEDFIFNHYLGHDGYISSGHSQLKLLLGRPGSGKTHLLRRLTHRAKELGYLAVQLSAKELRLQYINDLYAAVLRHIDLDQLVGQMANRVIRDMGYDPSEVPDGQSFYEWAIHTKDRIPQRARRDVEETLGRFFKSERTEPSFSLAVTQLAADCLGSHSLAQQDKDTIYAWLRGEKLAAAELRRVFIPRSIDRYSARDMLRAFATFIKGQGYSGLFVAIDEMEDLLATNPETGRMKYGRVALTDAYQSIRELIDDMPDIPATFMVLAGRTQLLWEQLRGVQSYDALWLRLQHEVVSPAFNPFAQLANLDGAVRTRLTIGEAKELCYRLLPLGGKVIENADLVNITQTESGDGVFRRLVQASLGAKVSEARGL